MRGKQLRRTMMREATQQLGVKRVGRAEEAAAAVVARAAYRAGPQVGLAIAAPPMRATTARMLRAVRATTDRPVRPMRATTHRPMPGVRATTDRPVRPMRATT